MNLDDLLGDLTGSLDDLLHPGPPDLTDPATRKRLRLPKEPGPWDGAFEIARQARGVVAQFERHLERFPSP